MPSSYSVLTHCFTAWWSRRDPPPQGSYCRWHRKPTKVGEERHGEFPDDRTASTAPSPLVIRITPLRGPPCPYTGVHHSFIFIYILNMKLILHKILSQNLKFLCFGRVTLCVCLWVLAYKNAVNWINKVISTLQYDSCSIMVIMIFMISKVFHFWSVTMILVPLDQIPRSLGPSKIVHACHFTAIS